MSENQNIRPLLKKKKQLTDLSLPWNLSRYQLEAISWKNETFKSDFVCSRLSSHLPLFPLLHYLFQLIQAFNTNSLFEWCTHSFLKEKLKSNLKQIKIVVNSEMNSFINEKFARLKPHLPFIWYKSINKSINISILHK